MVTPRNVTTYPNTRSWSLLPSVIASVFMSSSLLMADSGKLFPSQDPLKKTKIVATLGPASESVEMIKRLISNGLNMARVNASHGDHKQFAQLIKNVRRAAKELKKDVRILVDLQGPKIRVAKLDEPLTLSKGDKWVMAYEGHASHFDEYKDRFIPTVYKQLASDVKEGERVLFDDGFLQAKVLRKISKKKVHAVEIEVTVGGKLKSRKGINLPGSSISAPSLTPKDEEDLRFAIEQGVDAIGLSFVRDAEDILHIKSKIRKLLMLRGQPAHAPLVVAKIETPQAVSNLADIVKVTDAVMVARGDLGVEIGFAQVPRAQRMTIALSKFAGKEVITATQMLETMMDQKVPTRAEVDNIAHAVWQGSSAVMLSGETSVGQHPDLVVEMMQKIIVDAEKGR